MMEKCSSEYTTKHMGLSRLTLTPAYIRLTPPGKIPSQWTYPYSVADAFIRHLAVGMEPASGRFVDEVPLHPATPFVLRHD